MSKSFSSSSALPVLVAGGGIGGIAAALALMRQGFSVKVLEQAPQLGEIGAGIQLGPNAFAALRRAGHRRERPQPRRLHRRDGDARRARRDTGRPHPHRRGLPPALRQPVCGDPPRRRARLAARRRAGDRPHRGGTSTTVQRVDQDDDGVTVHDAKAAPPRRCADRRRRREVGGASPVRGRRGARLGPRGVPRGGRKKDFPADLQWNAASIWVGPNCHLVHYPLRGGEQYNVVVTFHSREQEEWSVREGSREEVQSYFEGICAEARQLIDLPKDWKRWATADREPIGQWTFGRAALLGDAAHPTLQYLAQGACMAMEDAVTLGEALRVTTTISASAFELTSARASHVPPASCCRRARWAASSTPRASSGWCATTCGKAVRPSASTTPWSGCTAGAPAPAWLTRLTPASLDLLFPPQGEPARTTSRG